MPKEEKKNSPQPQKKKTIFQAAWERGQKLSVHGAIYSLSDGLLRELTPPMSSAEDLDEAARAAEKKVLEAAAQGPSPGSEDGGEKKRKTDDASAASAVPIRRGASCEKLSELAPPFSLGTMLGAELGTHRWFESGGGSARARKEDEEKNGH